MYAIRSYYATIDLAIVELELQPAAEVGHSRQQPPGGLHGVVLLLEVRALKAAWIDAEIGCGHRPALLARKRRIRRGTRQANRLEHFIPQHILPRLLQLPVESYNFV